MVCFARSTWAGATAVGASMRSPSGARASGMMAARCSLAIQSLNHRNLRLWPLSPSLVSWTFGPRPASAGRGFFFWLLLTWLYVFGIYFRAPCVYLWGIIGGCEGTRDIVPLRARNEHGPLKYIQGVTLSTKTLALWDKVEYNIYQVGISGIQNYAYRRVHTYDR